MEIHLPHDILYMPKYYISQYNMLMAKKALQNKCPWKCSKRIAGEVAAALRYLYLCESRKSINQYLEERIRENWKKIIAAMMETGHTEEALKLMKSDIATSEILKDMLDEVDDVALKAYALDEIRRKKAIEQETK